MPSGGTVTRQPRGGRQRMLVVSDGRSGRSTSGEVKSTSIFVVFRGAVSSDRIEVCEMLQAAEGGRCLSDDSHEQSIMLQLDGRVVLCG